eukprot:PhM_4_TR7932/c0_g1_i1/m.97633
MCWLWHGKVYIGAIHGIAGILHMLMLALTECPAAFATPLGLLESLHTKIKDTMRVLRALTQIKSSKNYKSSLDSTSDKLVQLCHGATGFVWMWLRAHETYKDEVYLAAAVEAAGVVAERGLLVKSVGLCHGVGGNAMALLKVGAPELADMAVYFLNAIMRQDARLYEKADRPLSLHEGLSGFGYALIQALICVTTEQNGCVVLPGMDMFNFLYRGPHYIFTLYDEKPVDGSV